MTKAATSRQILTTALVAGLVAGALDITAAIATSALRGTAPMRLLQSVASGLLGNESFSGGAGTAALGLALHFLIMLGFAGVFVLIFSRSAALQAHALWSGIVYGVAVYAFMNVVVLPLSAFPIKLRYGAALLSIGIATHIVCVGVPMALVARARLGAGRERS